MENTSVSPSSVVVLPTWRELQTGTTVKDLELSNNLTVEKVCVTKSFRYQLRCPDHHLGYLSVLTNYILGKLKPFNILFRVYCCYSYYITAT